MAGEQSPEKSPPAPPPPSQSDQQSSSPPSSSPSAPPPQEKSSTPPPPKEEKSSPPPQQEKSSSPPPPPDSSSNSKSPPPPPNSSSPPPPPAQGSNGDNGKDRNDNKKDGDKGNDSKNNNKGGGSSNNDKAFSPPPPSKSSGHGSKSPSKSLTPPENGSGSRDSGQNMEIIIAVAAGAGLLLLVMILSCVCCSRKKKKKPRLDQMPYYGNNAFASGKAGGEYHSGPQSDHMVNLPPPPGAAGANWMHSTPPPPPGNWAHAQAPQAPVSGIDGHSSDLSSNFSGPHGPSLPPPHPSVALGFNKSTFTYDELAAATQGFSQAQMLGQGGFGFVHKGILPNGKEIAVKSLKTGSGQGEREFQAEVEIISRVHHRHLVSLVGYCIAGAQRMLVYEFLPNNTLEFHLHGRKGYVMDWSTRHKIALGSAKGLAYLHEDCHPRIIHRDIKGANILLDFNFEAKVADFGLAKLSQDNYTHVSTRVMGTFGYLAPEYASSGKLTEKSDVFSFGVMLLELITGRRPVDVGGDMEDSLVDWARPLCMKAAQDGDYRELVDPRIEHFDPNEVARMVACAAAAIRHSARRRPKMSQIVRALEGDASLDDLNDGVKPGQSSFFGSSTEGGSSDYDASTYSADMRRFRKVAFDSRDYASSEYGATSEYGLDPSTSSSEEIHRANNSTLGRRF